MSVYYINFYFRNLIYDEDYYFGDFCAPDNEIVCSFEFNRKTKECVIWNNNKPDSEILPLPTWWLDRMMEKQGFLKTNEAKISY